MFGDAKHRSSAGAKKTKDIDRMWMPMGVSSASQINAVNTNQDTGRTERAGTIAPASGKRGQRGLH